MHGAFSKVLQNRSDRLPSRNACSVALKNKPSDLFCNPYRRLVAMGAPQKQRDRNRFIVRCHHNRCGALQQEITHE